MINKEGQSIPSVTLDTFELGVKLSNSVLLLL